MSECKHPKDMTVIICGKGVQCLECGRILELTAKGSLENAEARIEELEGTASHYVGRTKELCNLVDKIMEMKKAPCPGEDSCGVVGKLWKEIRAWEADMRKRATENRHLKTAARMTKKSHDAEVGKLKDELSDITDMGFGPCVGGEICPAVGTKVARLAIAERKVRLQGENIARMMGQNKQFVATIKDLEAQRDDAIARLQKFRLGPCVGTDECGMVGARIEEVKRLERDLATSKLSASIFDERACRAVLEVERTRKGHKESIASRDRKIMDLEARVGCVENGAGLCVGNLKCASVVVREREIERLKEEVEAGKLIECVTAAKCYAVQSMDKKNKRLKKEVATLRHSYQRVDVRLSACRAEIQDALGAEG